MFLKCFLINQVQIAIPMIPILLYSCAEKEEKKRADLCVFKALQQLQKVQMESSAHIKCVRYTLYINILTFISLVVFWRYFLLKIVWFIKILFYRFLNLNLAIFSFFNVMFVTRKWQNKNAPIKLVTRSEISYFLTSS